MIAFAAVSGPLPKLGVIAAAALAGCVLLTRGNTGRAWAMLGALILAPVLLLADIWHSPQLGVIHRHPLETAVGAGILLLALAACATLLARRPRLLGPLAMVALPFRVPIYAGGSTANLLVPLYFVVAAGCLAWLVPVLWGSRAGARLAVASTGPDDLRRPAHRFERLLALYAVLYALQALYSPDFEKALQNMVFFYIPFALLLALVRDLEWDRALLARCLQITVGLAIVFALIGYGEYETRTLLLNPKLIAIEDVHPYFTVNSVFLDPDIFGRYLALVMILLVAVLVYDRRPRIVVGTTIVLAILWGALVLTLSRSSFGALLLGMAVLAGLRWRVKPVLVAVGLVVVLGGAAVAISPKTFGLNQGLNGASAGRANLVTGGLRMFGDRPVWGYGSGAFVDEYRKQNPNINTTLAASHTIPITIAAEQGLIGLLVYLALVISAVITLLRGARSDPARAAIAAAFIALVLHTMLYADFLEDPATWVLLGIGGALASRRLLGQGAAERSADRRRRSAARA